MSDERKPWLKFFPDDWRADPALRMCSYAARGLWMDMLALMHKAEPYGHLLVAGVAPTAQDLAGLLGGSDVEVAALLAMLEAKRVFSRTEDGTIYSRRMLRDLQQAERDKVNGKRGGNPRLKGASPDRPNPPDGTRVNGSANPTVNHRPSGGLTGGDKAQRPEARSQKESERRDPEKSARDDFSPPPPPAHARRTPSRSPTPLMPTLNDDAEAWTHLADGFETDDGGTKRPLVAGSYVDIVAFQVCEASGIDGHTRQVDWRPLIAWLREGREPPDIVAAIRAVAARPSYNPPQFLSYFDRAVRERRAA